MSDKFPLHNCAVCASTGCVTCYGKEIEIQAKQVGRLEAENKALRERVDVAKDLISEHMWAHQSPDSPGYNGCEKAECAWCGQARKHDLIDPGYPEITQQADKEDG